MKKFYSVRITVTTTNDAGKEKKHNEEYMVEAISVTDAEAKITERFEGISSFDYEVSAVRETKIVEVIK